MSPETIEGCVCVCVGLCVCVFRSGTINFPALCTLRKRKGFSLFFPFACRLFPSLSLSALPQIHTVIKVVRYINQSLYHFVTGIQKNPLVFVVYGVILNKKNKMHSEVFSFVTFFFRYFHISI